MTVVLLLSDATASCKVRSFDTQRQIGKEGPSSSPDPPPSPLQTALEGGREGGRRKEDLFDIQLQRRRRRRRRRRVLSCTGDTFSCLQHCAVKGECAHSFFASFLLFLGRKQVLGAEAAESLAYGGGRKGEEGKFRRQKRGKGEGVEEAKNQMGNRRRRAWQRRKEGERNETCS